MKFLWDDNKNRANRFKHGISFENAKEAFDDPFQYSIRDAFEGEERWNMLARIGLVTILLVVHTSWNESGEEFCRIISARKATPHERKAYDRNAGQWTRG